MSFEILFPQVRPSSKKEAPKNNLENVWKDSDFCFEIFWSNKKTVTTILFLNYLNCHYQNILCIYVSDTKKMRYFLQNLY